MAAAIRRRGAAASRAPLTSRRPLRGQRRCICITSKLRTLDTSLALGLNATRATPATRQASRGKSGAIAAHVHLLSELVALPGLLRPGAEIRCGWSRQSHELGHKATDLKPAQAFGSPKSGPTGSLLATLNLPTTGNGGTSAACNFHNFCPFVPTGVAFARSAQSVDCGGMVNQIGFDNITLGSVTAGGAPGPVPTPTLSHWAFILLLGLLAIAGVFAAGNRALDEGSALSHPSRAIPQ